MSLDNFFCYTKHKILQVRGGASIPPKLVAQSPPPNRGLGDGSPPAGSTPVRVWGQSPQKPENKRFMAFKKTICEEFGLFS